MDVGQHPSGKQSKVSVTSNCFSVCYPDYHIDQSYGSEIGHIYSINPLQSCEKSHSRRESIRTLSTGRSGDLPKVVCGAQRSVPGM